MSVRSASSHPGDGAVIRDYVRIVRHRHRPEILSVAINLETAGKESRNC